MLCSPPGRTTGGSAWLADWFPYQVLALRHGVCFLPQRVALSHWTPASFSAGQRIRQRVWGSSRGAIAAAFGGVHRREADVLCASNSWASRTRGARVVAAEEDLHDPDTLELVASGLLCFGRSVYPRIPTPRSDAGRRFCSDDSGTGRERVAAHARSYPGMCLGGKATAAARSRRCHPRRRHRPGGLSLSRTPPRWHRPAPVARLV